MKPKLTVHPAADVWPMMDEDRLNELAESIKANGLREPIKVLDGVLIDGRNRLRACELAGVEPTFEELNGVGDLLEYIGDLNGNRRDTTKGQRAMCFAMMWPEKGKRGRKKTGEEKNSPLSGELKEEYLRMARTVLAVMPELAKQVRDGTEHLNAAYAKAKSERQAGETTQIKLASLRKAAPDLASLVDEERMALQEALAAHEQRKREEKARREALWDLLERQRMFAGTMEPAGVADAIKMIKEHPEECDAKEIKKLARFLSKAWAEMEKGLE